jgi:hypothetical protein
MGVNTFKYKLMAFALGAAIGGLAGSFLASGQSGFINPDSFLLIYSMLFVAAVILGGAGNRWGVMVGAVLVAYLPERFRGLSDYRYLIFGLALMTLAIWRPQGLLPLGTHVDGSRRSRPRSKRSRRAIEEECPMSEREALLEVDDVTIKFGGLTALDHVTFDIKPGRDPRPDRTQRRRQDDLLQRDDRRLPGDVGPGPVRRDGLGASSSGTRSPGSASPGPSRTSGSSSR